MENLGLCHDQGSIKLGYLFNIARIAQFDDTAPEDKYTEGKTPEDKYTEDKNPDPHHCPLSHQEEEKRFKVVLQAYHQTYYYTYFLIIHIYKDYYGKDFESMYTYIYIPYAQ